MPTIWLSLNLDFLIKPLTPFQNTYFLGGITSWDQGDIADFVVLNEPVDIHSESYAGGRSD